MAKSTSGSQRGKQVGYAVVGLGHIAQTAVLPAFENARNSRLAALVSGDKAKLKRLARAYPGVRTFSYERLEECLAAEDVDAVYIAEPNTRHAEFAVRAARVGAHVLCEKPMAVTEAECRRMLEACSDADVKLMIAYRLHLEEANLRAVDLVRTGRIGEPRLFSSVFSYQAAAGNIRLRLETGGGPAWDIGVYCVNAARALFADEPNEVTAMAAKGRDERFTEVEEGMAAILRFPGDRLASFSVSFGATSASRFEVVGTEGRLALDNAYEYEGDRTLTWTSKGRSGQKVLPGTDQFGPELAYFSDCVLADREPQPSGLEGLADVRVLSAIYRSAASGRPVRIEPVPVRARPGLAQTMRRPPSRRRSAGVNIEAPTQK